MNRPSRSPWVRLALAALIGLWSVAGASARGEAFERALGPWIAAGPDASPPGSGTVIESGLSGTATLANTLVWVEPESRAEASGASGSTGIAPERAPVAHGWRSIRAASARDGTGPARPLRHLLCVYRL